MKRGNTKRKNDIIFILFSLVLGLLMGWLARDLTTGIPHAVIVNIGIWVFVSSLLSVYSPGASRAAVHVFIFFAGVIGAYYLHCVLLGETVSLKHLAYWLIFAVIGALIGFLVWHSQDREWLGALCCAAPISLLLAEGYPIYHSRSVSLLLDIAFAVVLYILLAPGKYQKLMALPFIIVFTFALVYFDAFSRIFGGWI